MNIYTYLNEIFEIFNKYGHVIIKDVHEHNDSHHYAEVIKIIKTPEGVEKRTSLSGGAQEAVWNSYEESYETFTEAFLSEVDIDDIVEFADAIYCVYKFQQRWRRISFMELCELDDNLCDYCNSRA